MAERLVLVGRQYGPILTSYRAHANKTAHEVLDATVAQATEKGGDYEVIEVEVVRRFTVRPRIASVDVDESAARPERDDEETQGDDRPSIEELVERSSLGTPGAKALRDSVDDETARRVVARARELEADARPVADEAADEAANRRIRKLTKRIHRSLISVMASNPAEYDVWANHIAYEVKRLIDEAQARALDEAAQTLTVEAERREASNRYTPDHWLAWAAAADVLRGIAAGTRMGLTDSALREGTHQEPGCTCGGIASCQQCQERDRAAALREGDRETGEEA